MFPVPSHLPRTDAKGISSEVEQPEQPDIVLDLLSPLFSSTAASSSSLSARQVGEVRKNLERAIKDNKARGHELLSSNFPSVSSHIRLNNEVQGDFRRVQATLAQLDSKIDSSSKETSFLPPLLSLVDRHITAVQSRARAQAHIAALTSLSSQSARLAKLEEAVWAGRGAEEWVVNDLVDDGAGYAIGEGDEILRGSQAMKLADDRLKMLKSMVAEQVADAFAKAVSFSDPQDGNHGTQIAIQSKISLQQPRISRSEITDSSTRPSVPPPYSLSHIFTALSRFGSLVSLLHNLRIHFVRDIIEPLVTGAWRVRYSNADNVSLLRLEHVEETRSPSDILEDISAVLTFVKESVYPAPSSPVLEREGFLSEIQSATFRALLGHVILTAMPSNLSNIPMWLELVQRASKLEDKNMSSPDSSIIRQFFESEAGTAWANQRRRRITEETRKLVLGGWGGWEAKEAHREKEVVMVVEVEIDDEDNDMEMVNASGQQPTTSVNDDGFGWGFENDKAKATEVADSGMDIDHGWGFDNEQSSAGPSNPRDSPKKTNGNVSASTEDVGDGWDFEDPIAPASVPEPPKPIIPAKPTREAKRLGRKVAKVTSIVDDDPWGSASESVDDRPNSTMGPSMDAQSHIGGAAPTADDWGGWAGSEKYAKTLGPKKVAVKFPKARRKELKEDTRMIKETFLVSRACEKLVDIADRVLQEAQDLSSTTLASSSFQSAAEVLLSSATDVFDLHRSLLPAHYAAKIHDVPTLAMQVHNDALHLVAQVTHLRSAHPSWTGSEDVARRLESLADYVFESQLSTQRDGLMDALDEANGFTGVGTDIGFRQCEKAINGAVHNIDSLSRVLKAVLPMMTYLSVMGYLLDETVQRISTHVLNLMDITEVESNRLNDLIQLIKPLEEIFVLDSGQPSAVVAHVPHWLKFCYISELLCKQQANLVDILYLFDSGALIDFTTFELVSLIRALFADSKKRDNAIKKIEKGSPADETVI